MAILSSHLLNSINGTHASNVEIIIYQTKSNGEKKILKCDGLLSTCLQHEINHLDGKLIIDHLSKLKRDIIIKKISKTKKNPDRILV